MQIHLQAGTTSKLKPESWELEVKSIECVQITSCEAMSCKLNSNYIIVDNQQLKASNDDNN